MKKFILWAFLPLLMMACSSSIDELDNSLPSSVYNVDCGKTTSLEKDGTLAIDNSFIASYSNGKISGKHVGMTEAVFNGAQKIKINVRGTVNYLNYPVTDWGTSMSSVKKDHKGGSLEKESGESLIYIERSGSKGKYMYGYMFENGKLTGATLLVPYTDTDRLVSWLKEKYYLLLTGDNKIFSGGYDAYTMDESHTVVGVTLQSMNTSQYVASHAYLLAWIPAKKSDTRSVGTYSAEDVAERMCDNLRVLGMIE